MSRFEELQKKIKVLGGFLALNKEEREEYQALKAQPKTKEPLKEAPKGDDDRIARLEAMVDKLSSENSNLRDESAKLQEGWGEYKPPPEENKTATLKVYRKDADSPAGVVIKVITFKNNAFNEETRKNDRVIFKITVLYDDGTTEEMQVDATDFVKIREIEKIEIVKEDRRTLRKVEDYVVVPSKDREGYPKRMLDGGSGYGQNIGSNKTPLEVFMVKSTVTVKRKNGQEFQMENDYLNL